MQGSVAYFFGLFGSPKSHTWSPIRQKTTDGNDQEAGEQHMSTATCSERPRDTTRNTRSPKLPCHLGDPDLWFAEDPADLERAKELCGVCPVRAQCLTAALEREEPWGVWGGQIFQHGVVIARKRPRGRPRKNGEPAAA